jgi:hypothetical protein
LNAAWNCAETRLLSIVGLNQAGPVGFVGHSMI